MSSQSAGSRAEAAAASAAASAASSAAPSAAGPDSSRTEGGREPPPAVPTAAVLIIGDEILTGKFRDENSPWLIDRLVELGLELTRIVVLPDDVEEIAVEVARCAAACDWVFTTGGVGPTHDDMTMAGIARALDQEIARHPGLVEVLERRLKDGNAEALRMADIPAGAELWWDGDILFPQVVVDNVVVFPGVPGLLRMKFDAVAHRFGGTPVRSRRLKTHAGESAIAAVLREAQERWPAVHVGSYPRYEERPWHVIVILDSRDDAALEACEAWLREALADQLFD